MNARTLVVAALLTTTLAASAQAQGRRRRGPSRAERVAAAKAKAVAKEKAELAAQQLLFDAADAKIASAMDYLLGAQEGEPKAEWPYEGVYRVRGAIPIGYRVGGTSLTALSMVQSPGYAESPERLAAVERATAFVTASTEHPLMASSDIPGAYDVRGWGYACGLSYLLRLETLERVPSGQEVAVKDAIKWFIGAIEATEIVKVGGWSYMRQRGFSQPAAPFVFMTGATLLPLFEAKAQGYAVDDDVVNRGIRTLQVSRKQTNGAYSYNWSPKLVAPVPGATGRMLIGEITLYLSGKGMPALLRGALDAFFVHWKWIDARRGKNGTHEGPYDIAPYYFYFAHYYAAMAIELLPTKHDRREYRRLLHALLMKVQLEDGTWNDRVFKRSASYGTALTTMALQMHRLTKPAPWGKPPAKQAPEVEGDEEDEDEEKDPAVPESSDGEKGQRF